jgi:hypothetical protein
MKSELMRSIGQHGHARNRAQRPRNDAAFLRGIGVVLCVGAMNLACSEGPAGGAPGSDRSPAPSEPQDPRAPGAAIFCGVAAMPDGSSTPELYVLYAMNEKLRQFPEFASAVGLEVVSSCEDARGFVEKYAAYYREHPAFDADETLGEMPSGDTGRPPAAEPGGTTTSKIFNGQIAFNDPIIEIVTSIPSDIPSSTRQLWADVPDNELCTATFINKNWLLTAAHCLVLPALFDCMRAGKTPAQCTNPGWDHYEHYEYRISRPTSDRIGKFWARAYIHPNWLANLSPDPILGANHDIALLYVPSEEDQQLLPDIDRNGAKRLSIVEPNVSWPMRFYGYGEGSSGSLRYGSMDYTLMSEQSAVPNVILGQPLTVDSPLLCKGDSGGPLMRTGIALQTNLGSETGLEAIVGIASSSSDLCDTPTPEELPLVATYWTRVDVDIHLNFIKNTMASNYPRFQNLRCTERRVANAPTDLVAECWGKACETTAECPAPQYCSNPDPAPIVPLRDCAACDSGCDCIKGQCLSL